MTMTVESRPQPRQLKFLVLGAAGAGKTSLLRRYFYDQFDQHRMPTLGSDFYWGKVKLGDSQEVSINIQMWDTPGKELRVFDLRKRRPQYTASFSDAFFQSAQGIMLVYDMLSSTSFTRLLKWYADLVELFNRISKKIPIIVVANKKDLWNMQYDQSGGRHPHIKTVPQRDVLGLTRKNYGGRDLRYEYSVATGGGTGEAPSKKRHNNNSAERSGRRRMEISSYLVNRDNWTNDCSYLESLLLSEDASQPDRDMVALWCLRNNLKLYEASAATGEGVKEAVEALVAVATEDLESNQYLVPNSRASELIKLQKLDLQQRYATSEEENCCFWLSRLRNLLQKQ